MYYKTGCAPGGPAHESGTAVNARVLGDTGLPGHRDSKSVVPRVSQEPICLADVAQPVRDNKLALHIKEKV